MAEIQWIYAPIGGGKTYYSVKELTGELARTERHCVFSLPVLLDDKWRPDSRYQTLQEWCDQWISKPVDIRKRVFFLTAEQQREFWRYLPADGIEQWQIEKYRLDVVANDIEGLGISYGVRMPQDRKNPLWQDLCDFTFRTSKENTRYYQRGCLYQLDEVHKSFPARSWQLLGPACEDYISEVRKFNDDLDLITQHPEKVDKNMRRNATQWVQVVNMERKRLFMGVTINKKFRWYRYPQTDMPAKNDKPEAEGFFNRGGKERIEFIYLTMWGQSVRGAGTAEVNRRKGLHPAVWLLAVVLIILFAKYFPLVVEASIAKGVGGLVKGVSKGVSRGVAPVMPSVDPPKPVQPVQSPAGADVPRTLPDSPPGHEVQTHQHQSGTSLMCLGWAGTSTNNLRVFLSDGRVAFADRGEIQGMGVRYVKVFGEPPIPVKQ